MAEFNPEERELIVDAKEKMNEIIYKDLSNPSAESMLKIDQDTRKAIYHYCPRMIQFIDFSVYINRLREIDHTVLEKYRNKTGEED